MVVDVSLGRVIVDFPFNVFVIVVVEGEGFVVVFKVTVSTLVMGLVDPAIVVVEVSVFTVPILVFEVDIVLVIVMNETPEDIVLVKVFVTVVVAIAIAADAADPWPGCALVITSVKYEVEPGTVTVVVVTKDVTVDSSMAVVVIAGAARGVGPARFAFFDPIQLNSVVNLIVEVADSVLVEVTTKGFPSSVLVRPGLTFIVIVRVVVKGEGRIV
jgi:copper chaperone CopZ